MVQKLQVTGNATFSSDITTNGDIILDNATGDPYIKFKTAAQQYVVRIDQSDSEKFQIRDTTKSLTRITLDTSGNVGIGTTSPSYKLDVVGSIRAIETSSGVSTGIALFNNTAGANNRVAIDFNTNYTKYASIEGGYGGAEPEMNFLVGNPTTQKMTIKNSGNVGIGTSSPTTRLDLGAGNTQEDGLGFGSNLSEIRRGNSGLNLQMSHWGNISMIIDSDGNDSSRFFNVMHNNNDSSSATELFRVQENGNVLIGSTSDTGQKLQVSGSIKTTTAGTGLQFYGTGGSGNIDAFGSNNLILMTNSVEKARITSGGNVLIGSTSDNGAKLQVTGIIRTTGGSVQAGQDYGFTLEDEGNNNRYGLKFGAAGSVGGSNLLMLTNRSLSNATGGGEVAIGANASTTGVTETEVMRIKANTQSEVSIDGILSLTVQDTPADPSNNKSSIWLDSNWDLKIKITNSSGDTVTKTIVEYA